MCRIAIVVLRKARFAFILHFCVSYVACVIYVSTMVLIGIVLDICFRGRALVVSLHRILKARIRRALSQIVLTLDLQQRCVRVRNDF